MRAVGVDISKWDVSFNPPAGLQFVIQRAAYAMVRDSLFDQLNVGVQKVPVRGAYHYLSTGASWEAQAKLFLSIVEGKNFNFYVCDFEAGYNEMSVGFAAEAIEWMRYVKAMTGKKVLVYSNISTYQNYMSKDARAKEFPFWIAWPPTPIPDPQTANPAMPAARSDWLFWQYSFGEHNTLGPANGVGRTGVDVDVYNGTFSQLCTWAGVGDVVPPAEPTDAEKLAILWKDYLERKG